MVDQCEKYVRYRKKLFIPNETINHSCYVTTPTQTSSIVNMDLWSSRCFMSFSQQRADCADLLEDEKWSSCSWVLNPEPYIKACTNDICSLQHEDEDRDTTALCATLSEYSRQCSHAGGSPPTWRTAKFCGKKYYVVLLEIIGLFYLVFALYPFV